MSHLPVLDSPLRVINVPARAKPRPKLIVTPVESTSYHVHDPEDRRSHLVTVLHPVELTRGVMAERAYCRGCIDPNCKHRMAALAEHRGLPA